MKRETEIKEHLVNNAIHLIAEGGFEKATTKELAHCGGHLPGLKMNETYIYRYFGSKEKLYEAAFFCLDKELFNAFRKGFELANESAQTVEERVKSFLAMAWRFILGDEERCRCYVRYYYSIYFRNSIAAHQKLFAGVISEMAYIFKEEADVQSILHSVFIALFDFCIRVYNGELEDNEVNRPHIINVLYCMMVTYFKDTVVAS